MTNIKILHMKQRRTNAKFHTTWIPQIRAASLINSLSNCTMERRAFFHTIPLLLSYRPTYKWFTITLNTPDLWEHRSTKKGSCFDSSIIEIRIWQREPTFFLWKEGTSIHFDPLKIRCYTEWRKKRKSENRFPILLLL